MRAILLSLVVATIILTAVTGLRRKAAPTPEPTEPLSALRVAEAPRESTPLTNEAAPAPVAVAPTETNDAVFDGRLLTQKGYPEKVMKHMDLRYLENSPAKDTPEAKAIQELLAKHSVGREAVPACYNLAYDVARHIRAGEKSGHAEEAQRMAMSLTLPELNHIKGRYNINDPSFFDALFQIKPTVFFGQKDRNEPQQGEKLLTE